MKTEKQLQNYIKRQCSKHKIQFYKLNCEGQTGFPDLMLLYNGHIVFIEVKSPAGTGRVSERQKIMIERLQANGAVAHVIDNKQDADHVITYLINR